jgi:hypothetical protein
VGSAIGAANARRYGGRYFIPIAKACMNRRRNDCLPTLICVKRGSEYQLKRPAVPVETPDELG